MQIIQFWRSASGSWGLLIGHRVDHPENQVWPDVDVIHLPQVRAGLWSLALRFLLILPPGLQPAPPVVAFSTGVEAERPAPHRSRRPRCRDRATA